MITGFQSLLVGQISLHVILYHLMLESLMDASLGGWNVELVRNVFLLVGDYEILHTSLNLYRSVDKLVWSCIVNGMFVIKIAYLMALNIMYVVEQGTSSYGQFHKVFWNKIWNMKLATKLNNFT